MNPPSFFVAVALVAWPVSITALIMQAKKGEEFRIVMIASVILAAMVAALATGLRMLFFQ